MCRVVPYSPLKTACVFVCRVEQPVPRNAFVRAQEDMARTPLREIVDLWYYPHIEGNCAPDTVYGYKSSINRHVLPRWGETCLAELRRADIQAWVNELAETAGVGGAWKAYKCLRQIIGWSIKEWTLEIPDASNGVREPRKPMYRFETLTVRRLKKLVRGMVGCIHEPTLIIQAALGLRPGENYYLRWESINWRTGMVSIRGSLQQVAGTLYECPPKTIKSERDLYLPPWALDRLHQIWVERGRPRGRIIGDAKPAQVALALKQWAVARKLPWVGMRNLRHTWATIAVAAKVPIEIVASMMGHTDIQTCYRYYMALTAAAQRRAQRRVARSLLGKTSDDMYKGVPMPVAPPVELPMAA